MWPGHSILEEYKKEPVQFIEIVVIAKETTSKRENVAFAKDEFCSSLVGVTNTKQHQITTAVQYRS